MIRFFLLLHLCLLGCLANETEIVCPGVTMEPGFPIGPRPMRTYWICADLNTPGVALDFSPINSDSTSPAKVAAAKPTDLLLKLGWKALINGDAFYVEGDEKKRYPTLGDTLVLQGFAIHEGNRHGQRSPNNGTFYLLDDRKTMGVTYDAPPKNSWGAVGGYRIVLKDSIVQDTDTERLHPRTAIGFNNATHKVYFLVVDGRQPGRSEGASERELGKAMKAMGATDAISLDGGGSSIMVTEYNGGANVINRPVGFWDQPGTVRCIGNAVGIIYKP